MANLKRCPCGEVPESILSRASGTNKLAAEAAPNCCGIWGVSFWLKPWQVIGSFEVLKAAEAAWNEAPRGA